MSRRSADAVTRPTGADVAAFVAAVAHSVRRRDAERLIALMHSLTGEESVMWGPSIIGFGSYHYRYASGREGDACAAGFSPRAAATTLYFPDGFDGYRDHLSRLGPHRTSVSCLYIKDLDGIDMDVLAAMIAASYATVTAGVFGTRLSGPSAGSATDASPGSNDATAPK